MHESALKNGQSFFTAYIPQLQAVLKNKIRVVDIGSYSVNGSLRDVCPRYADYVGVDLTEGPGVDVVLDNPYQLPFDPSSVDIVVSSSCFEHSELFWVLHLEIMRILKPHGLFYLNAPSAGSFHRFPVDCWRFYPDSGNALVQWGKMNGDDSVLLESFTQVGGEWNDYVAVFLKHQSFAPAFPARMLDGRRDFENGFQFGEPEVLNYVQNSQAMRACQEAMRARQGKFVATVRGLREFSRSIGLFFQRVFRRLLREDR